MAKNYFDEDYVRGLIKEYQTTTQYTVGEKNKIKIISKDDKLENKITDEIMKIVKAIIQLYRYYIFEPYEDCVQHGIHACYTNYLKFDIEKGTAFNYFSWIVKRSLLNYTDRRKKHRGHADVDMQVDLIAHKTSDVDNFADDFERTFIGIINENFLKQKRRDYLQISGLMAEYIRKNKKFISRTDMFNFVKSFGFKAKEIKVFMADIIPYRSDLFHLISNVEE